MKRRQCKVCNRFSKEQYGKVINTRIEPGHLPGICRTLMIRVYTVKCSNCSHKWTYRKKVKEI